MGDIEGHLDTHKIEDGGFINIDRKRNVLNAHCACLGPPGSPVDHRTPTMRECRLNRHASKAPLGLLVVWLRIGLGCDDRKQHFLEAKEALYMDRGRRNRAREWLQGQSDLAPLLTFEAEQVGKPLASVEEPLVAT